MGNITPGFAHNMLAASLQLNLGSVWALGSPIIHARALIIGALVIS